MKQYNATVITTRSPLVTSLAISLLIHQHERILKQTNGRAEILEGGR